MRNGWWIWALVACSNEAAKAPPPVDMAVDGRVIVTPDDDLGVDGGSPDASPDAAPDVGPDAERPDQGVDAGPDAGCLPKDEICDGVDQDCDGAIDEDFAVDAVCLAGPGAWCGRAGVQRCDGADALTCTAPAATVAECTAAYDGVLALGAAHTCVLGEGGTVRCFGANDFGQLGVGTDRYPTTPDGVVPLPEPATQIDAGGETTCALDVAGAVRCWGRNDSGQAGLDAWWRRAEPFPAARLPIEVTGAAAGYGRTCAVGGGAVTCWGDNAEQLLGVADTAHRGLGPDAQAGLAAIDLGMSVEAVVLGRLHTCARGAEGQVKCWGQDWRGQLGRQRNGALVVDPEQLGDALPVVELPGAATDLVAGELHTCALIDGAVYCWGDNSDGQLGRPGPGLVDGARLPADIGMRAVAIAAGGRHTCALGDDGRVKCWGLNLAGQLGLGDRLKRGLDVDQLGDALPYVDLDMQVVAIAGGARHTCAIGDAGQVKCWGENADGQLGVGDAMRRGREPGEMGAALLAAPLDFAAVAITVGARHTCARSIADAVQCWGANEDGQLGRVGRHARGDGPDELGGVVALPEGARQVVAGDRHTCAITAGGLRCFGDNTTGQLGLGAEWDRAAAYPAVDLGFVATQVSVGAAHACALGDAGQVKCWGSAEDQQVISPYPRVGAGPDQLGEALEPVLLGRPAVRIAAGHAASCALRTDGAFLCWGRADQSGAPRGVSAVALGMQVVDFSIGDHIACALGAEGQVKCWGDNRDGALGIGDRMRRPAARLSEPDGLPFIDLVGPALQVTTGRHHACALLTDGQVRCWGANDAGQLGLGDREQRGDEPDEMGEHLPPVELGLEPMRLVAGGAHSCALDVEGRLKCWGRNADGQLGNPDVEDWGDEPGEMGSMLPLVDAVVERRPIE